MWSKQQDISIVAGIAQLLHARVVALCNQHAHVRGEHYRNVAQKSTYVQMFDACQISVPKQLYYRLH